MPTTILSFEKAIQHTGLVSAPNNLVVASKPEGTSEGDLLVAFYGRDSIDTDPITVPSGWTRLYDKAQASSGRVFGTIAWKIATVSEPETYTFGSNLEGTPGVFILRISGFDPVTPIHAHAVQENSGKDVAWLAPNLATTIDNCLILRFAVVDGTDQRFLLKPEQEIATFDLDHPYDNPGIQPLAMSLSNSGIQSLAGEVGTPSYEISALDQYLPFTIAIAPYVPPPPVEVGFGAGLSAAVSPGGAGSRRAGFGSAGSLAFAANGSLVSNAQAALEGNFSTHFDGAVIGTAPPFRTIAPQPHQRRIEVSE